LSWAGWKSCREMAKQVSLPAVWQSTSRSICSVSNLNWRWRWVGKTYYSASHLYGILYNVRLSEIVLQNNIWFWTVENGTKRTVHCTLYRHAGKKFVEKSGLNITHCHLSIASESYGAIIIISFVYKSRKHQRWNPWIKGVRSANKFRKSQIRKFADLPVMIAEWAQILRISGTKNFLHAHLCRKYCRKSVENPPFWKSAFH
jgi:hypothetical protein